MAGAGSHAVGIVYDKAMEYHVREGVQGTCCTSIGYTTNKVAARQQLRQPGSPHACMLISRLSCVMHSRCYGCKDTHNPVPGIEMCWGCMQTTLNTLIV